MPTHRSTTQHRTRAAIVGALIALGVLLPVGAAYAAPDDTDTGTSQSSRNSGSAPSEPDSGTTCDDGGRDVDPSDGICSRDKVTGSTEADADTATEDTRESADSGDSASTCDDGRGDVDPVDGVCNRDRAPSTTDSATTDSEPARP